MTAIAAPDLPAAADAIDLADRLVGKAVRQLAALGGPDVHQVLAYDIAHAASGVATARSLLDYGSKGDVEAKITDVIGGRDEEFARHLATFGAEYGALTREDHRRFVDAFRNGMIPGVEAD